MKFRTGDTDVFLLKQDSSGFRNHKPVGTNLFVDTELPETSAKKVIYLMQTKYDGTRWGFINGITEVAQDFTLERRLDLERVAGDLLAA